MGFWDIFGLWLAAALTLGIVSFLYKDNIYYKACESIFVGASAGYWFVIYFWEMLVKKFYQQTIASDKPEFYPWVGLVLGILMLTRLFGKIGWVSRYSLAFIVGATAGVNIMVFFVSNAMAQVQATIIPVFIGTAGGIINKLIMVTGVTCGLIYFFFSKEHKGVFGGAARVGIWFLMITFGASFGYTVMSRMSLMLGRLDYLFGAWLGLIP